MGLTHRIAVEDDIPAMSVVMDAAITELQRGFLDPAQIASSRMIMGLDRQLVADRTYFVVEDVPYFVRSVRADDGDAILVLSDGTEEPLDPSTITANARGELYMKVKTSAKGGPFDAKMTRFAQGQLGPFLEPDGASGGVALVTKRGRTMIPAA